MPSNVNLQDVSGPAHIFNEARELGANIEMHFVSMSDKFEIKSNSGLFFTRLKHFEVFELSKNDFVIIPGLKFELLNNTDFLNQSKPFFDWLHFQYSSGVNVCSISEGMFLLVEAGILNSKECNSHWNYISQLYYGFPNVNSEENRLYVAKDNLFASVGVSAGVDLSLYIIENLFGPKISSDIAQKAVLYFKRNKSDLKISIFLHHRNHTDTRIHDAQDYMLEHLSSPITNSDIAEHVNMSMRNLTRLFKKTTGVTIGTYLEKIRVDRALNLLSNNNKVESVAKLCGYKNSNQLRILLKRHKRILPKNISLLD